MSVQVKSKLSLPVMFQKIDDINDESKRFIKVKIWLLHIDNQLITLGVTPQKNTLIFQGGYTLCYLLIINVLQGKNSKGCNPSMKIL